MVCSRYPKECLYYEAVLKRKCLRKIKNNVWENKIKWKLIEKADFHLRTKLLRKYFNQWMNFLSELYKKKINRRAADSLYEGKLKSKVILALKKNYEQNWMLLRICARKHEWNLKFRSWHLWKHYTQKRLKLNEINVLANRIREERLRVRFFYLWSYRLKEKRSQQVACDIAAAKHGVKLKRHYFNLWKIFLHRRTCKRKIEMLSTICYREKLVEKAFHSWRKQVYRKNRYRSFLKIIQNFHENYLLENYLNLWINNYRKIKFERHLFNYNLAVEFHTRKLLERCFRVLRKAQENAKLREEKALEFNRLYRNICVNYYLNVWMERKSVKVMCNYLNEKAANWREAYLCELLLGKLLEKYQERKQESEEMNKFMQYSNAIIIHRAFRGWLEVTIKHKNRRIDMENASEFYLDNICKKSFQKWKKYLCLRYKKKVADEYYRREVSVRAFNQWTGLITEKRLKLKRAKDLELNRNLKVVKNAFSLWKHEYELFKTKLNIGLDFYSKTTTSRVFCAWRKYTQLRIVNKSSYNHKLLSLENSFIKQMIFRWYEMFLLKQNVKKKLKKFNLRQEKRSVGVYFKIWCKFVDKMKNTRQAVDIFPQLYNNILLEQYLDKLLESIVAKRSFNKKEDLAKRVDEKLLKRRYLKKWVSFVCWKRKRIVEISAPRCVPEERVSQPRERFDVSGKIIRKKPIIPSYLKARFNYEEFEDEVSLNEETYTVDEPVNKKLPIVGKNFVSFDV